MQKVQLLNSETLKELDKEIAFKSIISHKNPSPDSLMEQKKWNTFIEEKVTIFFNIVHFSLKMIKFCK